MLIGPMETSAEMATGTAKEVVHKMLMAKLLVLIEDLLVVELQDLVQLKSQQCVH